MCCISVLSSWSAQSASHVNQKCESCAVECNVYVLETFNVIGVVVFDLLRCIIVFEFRCCMCNRQGPLLHVELQSTSRVAERPSVTQNATRDSLIIICVVVSFVSCIIRFLCVDRFESCQRARGTTEDTACAAFHPPKSVCCFSQVNITPFGSHHLFRLERGNDSRRTHIESVPET